MKEKKVSELTRAELEELLQRKVEEEEEEKQKNRVKSLEQEFSDLVKNAKAELDVKVKAARKALEEAEAVSEKYGIPFYFDLCQSEIYTPETYAAVREKFEDLREGGDDDVWGELLHTLGVAAPRNNYSYDDVSSGWSNSSYSC
jgi:hypothetical protein